MELALLDDKSDIKLKKNDKRPISNSSFLVITILLYVYFQYRVPSIENQETPTEAYHSDFNQKTTQKPTTIELDVTQTTTIPTIETTSLATTTTTVRS